MRAAKKPSKGHFNETNLKAVLALSVVILAFMMFDFFNTKKEDLIDSDQIKQVGLLISIGMALLVTVIYLAFKSPSGKKK